MNWTTDSWRGLPAAQQPEYCDPLALETVESCLASAAPITSIAQSRSLKRYLAEVAAGRAFLLQGGDCAESFAEFGAEKVRRTFNLLLQMGAILETGGCERVVTVARMAGQFGKPRSAGTETIDGVTLPVYRGDIVNGPVFDPVSRNPDPVRMLEAHRQSKVTMELVAAYAAAAYADQSQIHRDARARLGLAFESRTAGGAGRSVEMFTSHEALLLNYEQALLRWDETSESWWSVAAHMLWIGDRTRQLGGAHIEFVRGLANPIGIKCGPSLDPDVLLRLAEAIDPDNEPGRLVLIGRFGAGEIAAKLPALMRATRRAGLNAVWSIDPMHGNTVSVAGRKTRLVPDILAEIGIFFEVAEAEAVHPGGIHLEMSGEEVTECLGGSLPLQAEDLPRRYLTHCDPRLNPGQALDVTAEISRRIRDRQPRSDAA